MIFNVAGLLKEQSGAVRKVFVEDEELESEQYGYFEAVNGRITLMRTDRTVMVTGTLEAENTQSCSRCLEPALLIVTTEIAEEFRPTNTDVGGVQRKLHVPDEDDDPVLLIDDRNNLDLTGVALQSFEGAVPIAPLCQADCRGLCPVCSKDRNKESCSCVEDRSDPRWRGLAGLGSPKGNSPK